MSSTQLVKVDVPIRVTLPAAVSRIDIDSHLEPGWRDRVTGIEETPLAAVIARTRASHYHWLMNQVIAPAYGSNDPDYQPKGEHPERIDTARLKQLAARSALWAREAITQLRPQSKERRMERQRLLHNLMYAATWLRRAGDKAAAAGILSEILRECKKFPEGTERLRRKAEDELAGLN